MSRSDPLRALDRLRISALRLLGARSRFLDTSVGALHWASFRGTGQGQIVLVHGLAGSMGDFAALVGRLRRRFEGVHALDLPGHGRSDDPTTSVATADLPAVLGEALDAVELQRTTLFGHSMGGYICARFASLHPQRVEHLLLVSPGGAPSSEEVLEQTRRSFTLESLQDARAFVDRLLLGPRWYSGLMARGVLRRMSQPFLRDLVGGISNDDALSPREVGGLSMPILFLWGELEPMFAAEHLRFWTSSLPAHARVEHPAGWGHVPLWEQPAELVERIVSFLESTE